MHHILFIQGGGEGGYEADLPMVTAFQQYLGESYTVSYPKLLSDEKLPDYGWTKQIEEQLATVEDDLLLVGHSFGASMIVKLLSEAKIDRRIKAVFLLATPFWQGDEDWKEGFKLKEDFAEKLPAATAFHFYHCRDDDEVSFNDFITYQSKLKKVIFHPLETGGHLFTNNLGKIAEDIKTGYGKK